MIYEELLKSFNEELKDIHLRISSPLEEANLVIGRKGKYKNLSPEESKKILKDTEDHIFERDIPDSCLLSTVLLALLAVLVPCCLSKLFE